MEKYFLSSIDFDRLKWESTDLESIFATQRLSPDISEREKFAEILELRFQGDELIEVFEHLEGQIYPVELSPSDKQLGIPKAGEIHLHHYLISEKTGSDKLFGQKSGSLQFPSTAEKYTVNYFGTITRSIISWLPFKEIELFSPEYLRGILFIDYKNPSKPRYLNEEVIEKINFPDKDQDFTIKYFEEMPFRLSSQHQEDEGVLGCIGMPEWIQQQQIPRCPETNRVMKFMLEIDRYHEWYPEGEGNYDYEPAVIVFMEPISKIVGIVLQTT